MAIAVEQEKQTERRVTPTLVLIKHPQTLGFTRRMIGARNTVREFISHQRRNALNSLQRIISGEISKGFEDLGCSTITLERAESEDIEPNGNSHAVIINPVYTPDLTPGAEEAIRSMDPLHSETDPSFAEIRKQLVEYLPEIGDRTVPKILPIPYVHSIGNRVADRLDIKHPYFVNQVTIGDNKNLLRDIPDNWRSHFGWVEMAKTGSSTILVTPYQRKNGKVYAEGSILQTLEGGNVFLPFDEIADELVPLGSTAPLPDSISDTSIQIPRDIWLKSEVVAAIQAFGAYCGRRGFVRPSMMVDDMVRGRLYARFLRKAAGYSQQGEGAFYGYDPNMFIPGFSKEPGVAVVTRSGRWKVIKTDIRPGDLNACQSTDDFSNVRSIGLEGEKMAGSSVEAIELVNTQPKLILQDPQRFGIFRDGRLTQPIVYQIHLHGWIDPREMPEGGFTLPWDFRKHNVGSCGKDTMLLLMDDYTKDGVDLWRERDMRDRFAVGYIKRHGLIMLVFRSPKEDITLWEIMTDLMRRLDRTRIIPVPQVRNALLPDPDNYHQLLLKR